MNFQTSEEIRRINIALDSLKRRASSKLLQSRRKQIDPIFQEQILIERLWITETITIIQ